MRKPNLHATATSLVRRARAVVPTSVLVVSLGLASCSANTDDSPGSGGMAHSGQSGQGASIGGSTVGGERAGGTAGVSLGAGAPAGGTPASGGAATGGTTNAGSGGTTDTAGAAGAAGSAGTNNSAGRAGADGVGGTNGSAGTSGTAGRVGAGGRSGSAGRPGVGGGGTTGSAGTSGSAGRAAAGAGTVAERFVGNITTNNQVRSDFVTYWDQITPENEGKWGSVEGQRDVMNWAGMDRVRDYARQHGIPYKGHTFVWGSQQPSWLAGLAASEQRAEVEEWIRLFCERYPDVAMIDVVNEPPPHTTPVYMNALGGAGASGYDWIVQSFRWARQYCPNAILILNDYNTIEYTGDNDRFIDIVNRIRQAGAPIDAIGAQAHDAYKWPTSTIQNFLNRLVATGLPVYITEYDINLADDQQQRTVMESQFTMFWNTPAVRGVTLWGYVSGATWVPNSGLMSSGGQQRPAMVWLRDFLSRN